jgi:hypothetical protein
LWNNNLDSFWSIRRIHYYRRKHDNLLGSENNIFWSKKCNFFNIFPKNRKSTTCQISSKTFNLQGWNLQHCPQSAQSLGKNIKNIIYSINIYIFLILFPSALLWSVDGLFVLQNTLKCIVFHVIWMLFTYANNAPNNLAFPLFVFGQGTTFFSFLWLSVIH